MNKKIFCFSMQRINSCFSIALVLFFVFAMDIIISKSVFPLTEGWWEYYSELINYGMRPYIDFGLRLPPLYIYFLSLMLKFFGNDFFSLRVLMSLIHVFSAWITFLWLRKFVDAESAAFGVAVSVGLVMSNPVYLPKDYHTVVALFVVLLAYVSEIDWGVGFKKIFVNVILVSFFSACLLLVKQNVGLLVLFACISRIVTGVGIRSRPVYAGFVVFLVLFIVAFLLSLFSYFVDDHWVGVFFGNDSKGGFFTVATRFLTSKYCLVIQFLAVVLVFISYVADRYYLSNLTNESKSKLGRVLLGLLAIFLVASKYLDFVILSFSLAWLVLRFYMPEYSVGEKEWWRRVSLLVFMLSIAYAGTNTAGYNFVSLEILIAICSAEIFSKLKSFGIVGGRYLNLIPVLFFLFSVSPKASSVGYNWWGYRSGGLLPNYEKVPLPFSEFEGITTDKQTALMFQAIFDLRKDLGGEAVFAYPSIPIVYFLLGQKPIGSPVLWFDVAAGADGVNTVSALDKSRPKYIFWLLPPEEVYFGHYKLRKTDPVMLEVDNWLIESIRTDKYKIVKAIMDFDGADNCSVTEFKFVPLGQIDGTCKDGNAANGAVDFSSVKNMAGRFQTDYFSGGMKINRCSLSGVLGDPKCIYRLDRHVLYVLKRSD